MPWEIVGLIIFLIVLVIGLIWIDVRAAAQDKEEVENLYDWYKENKHLYRRTKDE